MLRNQVRTQKSLQLKAIIEKSYSARPTGLEPAIYPVTGDCVIQLHHGRIF